MEMPGRKYTAQNYRYGFNGKENDKENTEGIYDYGFRTYDSKLGRFFSKDPLFRQYPELTPYQFASNRPIDGIDLDGLEWKNSKGDLLSGKDLNKVKVYILYDPEAFTTQALKEYNDAVAQYGEGSAALSAVNNSNDFVRDWGDIKGAPSKIVVNLHGRNQSIYTPSGNQLTSTGDGKTNKVGSKAYNIQDLPFPKANLNEICLELNTCHSDDRNPNAHDDQGELKGSKLTVAQTFREKYDFKSVRGTEGSVNFYGTPKDYLNEFQYFYSRGAFKMLPFFYKPYPVNGKWNILTKPINIKDSKKNKSKVKSVPKYT